MSLCNPYQLPTRSNVDSQNPPESGGPHSSQTPLTGQQHYPSHPLRRNGTNGDRGLGDPLGNGRHYLHISGGGHGGPMEPQKVVPQIVFMEVVQIVPLPLNLGHDVDMIDVLNNMSNLNKV